MNGLAMTAFNRPDEFSQVLDSLERNHTRDWRVFLSVDPGDRAVLDLAKTRLPGMEWAAPPVLSVNMRRLGPDKNIRKSIEMAFDEGCDFMAYQQDDVLLSPDCLELAEWFRLLPDREQYMALWHFNYESDPARPLDVVESRGEGAKLARGYGSPFYSLGWSCSRKQWERLAPTWNRDARGCDWSLSGWLDGRYQPQQVALVPALSRNQHIGREGTYTTATYWDWVFRDHPWNRERHSEPFRLVKGGDDAGDLPAMRLGHAALGS